MGYLRSNRRHQTHEKSRFKRAEQLTANPVLHKTLGGSGLGKSFPLFLFRRMIENDFRRSLRYFRYEFHLFRREFRSLRYEFEFLRSEYLIIQKMDEAFFQVINCFRFTFPNRQYLPAFFFIRF